MSVRIKDVATLLGVTQRTLRYYEAKGLIDPPRDRSGCRNYDPTTREQLKFIVALRRAGLSLREVEEALALGASNPAAQRRHIATAIGSRVRHLERLLAETKALASELGDAPPLAAERGGGPAIRLGSAA